MGRIGLSGEWPVTPTGARKTDEKTWREMAARHRSIERLAQVQIALAQMKTVQPLAIGPDGRARLGKKDLAYRRLHLPYSDEDTRSSASGPTDPRPAAISRCPPNSSCSGTTGGVRSSPRLLARPCCTPTGAVEEIAIAAYLSGDPTMIRHYRSGDFYLAFGRGAGLVPQMPPKLRTRRFGTGS